MTGPAPIRLLGLYAGPVVHLDPKKSDGRTGIAKRPVAGSVAVSIRGLEGDDSAYRSRELGDTAVHAFACEHYAYYAQLAGRPIPAPCFGENLSLSGYTETEARLGDQLRVGTALLQVVQPVTRCRWPGFLADEPRLAKWATQSGRTGFYLQVIEPGMIAPDDPVTLEQRGDAAWTIARLNQLYAEPANHRPQIQVVLALPTLAERWKAVLRKRLGAAVG